MGCREPAMTQHGRQEDWNEMPSMARAIWMECYEQEKDARAKGSNYVKRAKACTIRVQVSQVSAVVVGG